MGKVGFHTELNTLKQLNTNNNLIYQIFLGSPLKYQYTLFDKYPEINVPFYIHSKYISSFRKNPNYKLKLIEIENNFLKHYNLNTGVIVHFDTLDINNLLLLIHNKSFILETNSAINSIGSDIRDLILISKYCPNIFFCIDTAHIFINNYDIQEYIFLFLTHIGINKLKLFHLNDSDGMSREHKNIGNKIFPKYSCINLHLIKYINKELNVDVIFERRILNELTPEIKKYIDLKLNLDKLNNFIRRLIRYYFITTHDPYHIYLNALISIYENNIKFFNKNILISKNTLISYPYIGEKIANKIYTIIKTFKIKDITGDDFINSYIGSKNKISGEDFIKLSKTSVLPFYLKEELNDIVNNILILFNKNVFKNINSSNILNLNSYLIKEYKKYLKNTNNIFMKELNTLCVGSYSRKSSKYIHDLDIITTLNLNMFIQKLNKIFKIEKYFKNGNYMKSFLCNNNGFIVKIDVFWLNELSIESIISYKLPNYISIYLRTEAKKYNYKLNIHGLFIDNNLIHFNSLNELCKLLFFNTSKIKVIKNIIKDEF